MGAFFDGLAEQQGLARLLAAWAAKKASST